MPKIPSAESAGLGEARYARSGETPVLGRAVAKEVGPAKSVSKLDVVQEKAAPTSQFKPVLPGNEADYIQHGLGRLEQHMEQLARIQQEEIRKVNEAKERTGLLVTMGDQKSAYRQNTLDIINNPDMPNEEKAENLKTLEDDFRATIQEAKPQYQPVVASEVMGTIGAVQTHAQQVFLQNQQDGIKADLTKRASQLTLDAASTGDLAGSLANFDALHGAYKSAGLTDAHFTADRQKFEQGILQNDIMGQLKSVDVKSGMPALQAVTNMLNLLNEADDKGVPKNWTRLDPHTRNADIAAVINKKNEIESKMKAAAEMEVNRLPDFIRFGIDDVERKLKDGLPPDRKMIIGVTSAIQELGQTDDPKRKLQSLTFLNQYNDVVKKYNADYQFNEKTKNPLFGTGVQDFSFSDFATPENMQAVMSERMKVGSMVAERDHLNGIPLLTKNDADMLSRVVSSSPQNGIRLIETIGGMLGPKAGPTLELMAGQMANSKDADSAVVSQIIGSMSRGDKTTAMTLADGMQAMKNDSIKKPNDKDFRETFRGYVGSSFSETGDVARQHYESFKAAYMSMSTRAGISADTIDDTTAQKALAAVVGPTTKVNKGTVLLPNNKSENEFLDYISSISPETVQAWGGVHGMTNEKGALYIKEDAQWKKIGPTRYALISEGKRVWRKDGKDFIIDTKLPLISPLDIHERSSFSAETEMLN